MKKTLIYILLCSCLFGLIQINNIGFANSENKKVTQKEMDYKKEKEKFDKLIVSSLLKIRDIINTSVKEGEIEKIEERINKKIKAVKAIIKKHDNKKPIDKQRVNVYKEGISY